MTILKRISTSLFSTIDQVVGEIENHDALIRAAIDEQRKKIAAAKVQLNRVRNNEKRLRDQIAEYSINEKRWGQRAVKEAKTDESKALECMQRRQAAQAQIEKLKIMAGEYYCTSQKMAADIQRCEEELNAMQQKHEIMRARQTSADALNVVTRAGEACIEDLDRSFERWEVKIAQSEMHVGALNEIDLLEQEYLTEENAQNLKMELAALIEKESDNEH